MSGLLALLDDVAAIAKVAAASLDDVTGQAAKAGAKAAGAVIDDAAVTPKYLQGFAPRRELPIVGKIALGSLVNKLVILLPLALLLSTFAPWAITPLLMIGGAYLCFEGAEKVHHWLFPSKDHGEAAAVAVVAGEDGARMLEEARVKGAIKTDFILSAEIMTIALAAIPPESLWMEGLILAIVGIMITAVVYGGVALIVKMDDIGLSMSRYQGLAGGIIRAVGRGLVKGMPVFMKLLTIVGTAAMIWVGGSIVIHGLESFGLGVIGHEIEDMADAAADAVEETGTLHSATHWIVTAFFDGIFGLALGFALIPLVKYVITPVAGLFRRTAPEAGH
ncbi:ABC transporter [Haematobacter massiliensis]|uniref:Uncharacterized protein n=1 Tax=Haematobacter massiliensis TaxID=195105 RepID=A0A086YBN4_9RHOB|nr:DUF808 domain-containing protein [Haematobacter massiliensis]KFI31684.1 hypothetical protein CN97_04415 [Haematobacter massiliensis]OWJ72073.1 ABC transporter [Haematobacter massiliensis]OWJ81576.1 ABC transporter [Haematobacter massiliensis]QBJ24079.1 DUF808 domain-containing protein [Haematobacter massiliensis]